MIYTDGYHLIADSLHELCEYAASIRLNYEWLELGGKNINPHLDICGKVKQRVLADERVKQITSRELVKICKLNYREPKTEEEVKEWEQYNGKKVEDFKASEKDYDRMMKNIFDKAGVKL